MDIVDLEDRHRDTEAHFGRLFQRYSLLQQINLSPVDEVSLDLVHLVALIDEAEQQESYIQQQQHLLLKDLWNDWPPHRLYPALVGDPRHILDCGFGTGIWSAEVARKSSAAVVSHPHMIHV